MTAFKGIENIQVLLCAPLNASAAEPPTSKDTTKGWPKKVRHTANM